MKAFIIFGLIIVVIVLAVKMFINGIADGLVASCFDPFVELFPGCDGT